LRVHLLEYRVHLGDSAERFKHFEFVKVFQPDWAVVREAILRLDRKLHPSLSLHMIETSGETITEGMVFVAGGEGEYHLAFYEDDVAHVFEDSSRFAELEVMLWALPEPNMIEQRKLCNDLDWVLEFLFYFCASADLGEYRQYFKATLPEWA